MGNYWNGQLTWKKSNTHCVKEDTVKRLEVMALEFNFIKPTGRQSRMTCAPPWIKCFWLKPLLHNKNGVIICLPKPGGSHEPSDFRPITLFNADYKRLARITVQRLRPLMAEHLQATPFCGVPRNTILDAVATVCELIARAHTTRTPLWVLSQDFQKAFDKISH